MRNSRHIPENAIDCLGRGTGEFEIAFRKGFYQLVILPQESRSGLLGPVVHTLLSRRIPRHLAAKRLCLRVPQVCAFFHGYLHRICLLRPPFAPQVMEKFTDHRLAHLAYSRVLHQLPASGVGCKTSDGGIHGAAKIPLPGALFQQPRLVTTGAIQRPVRGDDVDIII